MNKRDKMVGVPVSKDEVIAALGKPSAEWERNSRHLEFQKHLGKNQTELDIAGIRGYGGRDGFLAYLRKSLVSPSGVGTSLVSEEENAAIRAELEPEIKAEINRYEQRLAELEKSPEAVQAFIHCMEWWLECLNDLGPDDPAKETDDVVRALAEDDKRRHEREISILTEEINVCKELLANLRGQSSTP